MIKLVALLKAREVYILEGEGSDFYLLEGEGDGFYLLEGEVGEGLFTYYVSQKQGFLHPPSPLRQQWSAFG